MNRASLRSLRVFCLTAELGSFKKTAAEIFLTPSAVSHQIKTLEEQLGIALFERKTREIHLTARGQRLFASTWPLLQQIDAAVAAAIETPSRNQVTLSSPPFFATELLIPALPEIAEQFPSMNIRLLTETQTGERLPAEADLAILLAAATPASVQSAKLFALHLIPVASPRLGIPLQGLAASLSQSTLIIHRSRRNAWRRWFKDRGALPDHQLKIIELDSMFAVARAAEQGLGAALVPPRLVGKWLLSGALQQLSDQSLNTGDSYFLCWRDREPSDIAKHLTDRFKG